MVFNEIDYDRMCLSVYARRLWLVCGRFWFMAFVMVCLWSDSGKYLWTGMSRFRGHLAFFFPSQLFHMLILNIPEPGSILIPLFSCKHCFAYMPTLCFNAFAAFHLNPGLEAKVPFSPAQTPPLASLSSTMLLMETVSPMKSKIWHTSLLYKCLESVYGSFHCLVTF